MVAQPSRLFELAPIDMTIAHRYVPKPVSQVSQASKVAESSSTRRNLVRLVSQLRSRAWGILVKLMTMACVHNAHGGGEKITCYSCYQDPAQSVATHTRVPTVF